MIFIIEKLKRRKHPTYKIRVIQQTLKEVVNVTYEFVHDPSRVNIRKYYKQKENAIIIKSYSLNETFKSLTGEEITMNNSIWWD